MHSRAKKIDSCVKCVQCNQKLFDYFFLFFRVDRMHLAAVAVVAAVANWNDDKSNFIKYRYIYVISKQKVCSALLLLVLFVCLFVEITVGFHLLQWIECTCNQAYHTTKFLLYSIIMLCYQHAMCQFKYSKRLNA